MPAWLVDITVGLALMLIAGVFGFIGWIVKTGVEKAADRIENTLANFGEKLEDLLTKSGMHCLWIDGHEKLSSQHGKAIHNLTEKTYDLDQKIALQVNRCKERENMNSSCWTNPSLQERRFNERD